MTKNQIDYQRMLEESRANLAREAETNRANMAGEQLRNRELAESARHNLATESEATRSNTARETENLRSNLAKEQENYRHDLASENIGAMNVSLGYANLGETQAHNAATEAVAKYNALETNRSNLAKELETNRSNIAREKEQTRSNLTNEANQIRLENLRQQGLDRRQSKELTQKYTDTAVRGVSGLVNSLSRLFGGR